MAGIKNEVCAILSGLESVKRWAIYLRQRSNAVANSGNRLTNYSSSSNASGNGRGGVSESANLDAAGRLTVLGREGGLRHAVRPDADETCAVPGPAKGNSQQAFCSQNASFGRAFRRVGRWPFSEPRRCMPSATLFVMACLAAQMSCGGRMGEQCKLLSPALAPPLCSLAFLRAGSETGVARLRQQTLPHAACADAATSK
ncbi:hypothetical protein GGI09_008232 [Coemansia sp. S100]|nr:hypothetical protein GGI09_008232 [Coemansia sp. S100]